MNTISCNINLGNDRFNGRNMIQTNPILSNFNNNMACLMIWDNQSAALNPFQIFINKNNKIESIEEKKDEEKEFKQ